jgi:hypothetical protein
MSPPVQIVLGRRTEGQRETEVVWCGVVDALPKDAGQLLASGQVVDLGAGRGLLDHGVVRTELSVEFGVQVLAERWQGLQRDPGGGTGLDPVDDRSEVVPVLIQRYAVAHVVAAGHDHEHGRMPRDDVGVDPLAWVGAGVAVDSGVDELVSTVFGPFTKRTQGLPPSSPTTSRPSRPTTASAPTRTRTLSRPSWSAQASTRRSCATTPKDQPPPPPRAPPPRP